jgi:hypothetical protein
MSALDFRDREPEQNQARRPNHQVFANNRAFYERLQGQGRKSTIERYGWIAVPIAAVAIIGIATATSIPRQSADDVAGSPAQNTASIAQPAPATTSPPPALNEALASNAPAKDAGQPAIDAPKAARSPASAPAPVKVARKAPAADAATTTRPASAAPAQSVPAPTPAPTVTQDAAPQANVPTPSSDNNSASPPVQ